MTYANSFWASLLNNTKRRIWVWALAFFANLMTYPAVLTVYFTRIDKYLSYGNYNTNVAYKSALSQAALDMFTTYTKAVPVLLAVLIGIQGFSYLFSKRKVDMYHAVPVSSKRRFFTIYMNGILAYIISLLFAVVITFVMVAIRGIMNSSLFSKMCTCILIQFLVFLAVYNVSIWATTITGNLLTAVIIDGIILFYVSMWDSLIGNFKTDFYQSLCTIFNGEKTIYGLIDLYTNALFKVTVIGAEWKDITPTLISNGWKLLIWMLVPVLLAYVNYRKRPAEAAGKSIAFYSSRIIIKLMIVVPISLMLGRWVYYFAEQNITLMIISLIVGTVIMGLLVEMLFNQDFLSAFKHWGSVVVALAMVMGFFLFFKLDVAKFDAYVPEASEIDSYAIYNEYEGYYTDAIDFNKGNDNSASYISTPVFAKDNMFLTDTDAIVKLAKKSRETARDDMGCAINIDVLYRLNNGKTKSRTISVDICDKSNDDLLNRIVGPAYYKEGVWQAMTMDVPTDVRIFEVNFSDGNVTRKLNISSAYDLAKLWREDMANYDYDRVRYDDELGYISILFDNYNAWNLPVYECFTNTVKYLKNEIGDIDQELPLEAIESITICYYGNDSYDQYQYEDIADIKAIMNACYKSPAHSGWKPWNEDATDYGVEINLTSEYIKTYNTFSLYSYRLSSEKIDDLRAQIGLP